MSLRCVLEGMSVTCGHAVLSGAVLTIKYFKLLSTLGYAFANDWHHS